MERITTFTNLRSEVDDALINKNDVRCCLTTKNGSTLDLKVESCDFDYNTGCLTLSNDYVELTISEMDINNLKKDYCGIRETLDYWFTFNGSDGCINIDLAA